MFYVSDLEKAAKFHENALGLKRVWTDKEQEMIGLIFRGLSEPIEERTHRKKRFCVAFSAP
jgi:catechol 2,3-dioxygenase-like lactoylglutathione lyase family enzyme